MEPKQLNILFLTHYSAMYGANQSLCTLILELKEFYNINPIVMLRLSGPICDFFDRQGIKYYISHFYWWLNDNRGLFQIFLNVRKQIRNWLRLSKWVKLIEKEKINLVYTNSVTINIGVFISRRLNCPHIWHIREGIEQFPLKYSLGKFLSKIILKNGADKYILISDFLVRNYVNMVPMDRVVKIYNGVSIRNESRKSNQIETVLHLCMTGVVTGQKNQTDAVKAIGVLVKKGFKEVHLHIVGGEVAGYRKELNDYIETNSLQSYITFHGHKASVHSFLDNMNIGLMCSRDEAFGRVTIEFMLHKMPVIASNSGANPELVINRINGDIYTLNNPVDLAEKIEKYLANPSLLQKVGLSAYLYAKQNFSSKKNTDSVYSVIQELAVK